MTLSAVRAAVHVAAVFAIYLSIAMLLPALVDLASGNPDWKAFAFSALLLGGFALAVALATHGRPPMVTTRFGFLLVNMLWVTISIAGAVPFMASSLELSVTDAFFESVSGVTTTGATVINGLDSAPPGLLLWRSMLVFMGGLGVIVLGLFLLPFLNIGGVSYFKIESSDIEDRPFERFQTFIVSLLGIYAALVTACAILFAAAGMKGFDAINHAMGTVATSGFSTHDTSFLRYADNPAILWIGTFFMFVGGLPFSIMILLAVRGRLDALRDPQIRVFAGYSIAFTVAIAVYLYVHLDMPVLKALTHSAFNVISIITTTGYASDDYTESPLGLTKHDDRRFAADFTWAVNDRTSLYLQGGYEDLALAVFGSETFAATDWNSQHRDRFRSLGAGVKFANPEGKVDANFNLHYARGTSGIAVTSDFSGSGPYPDLKTDSFGGELEIGYRWSDAIDLRFTLRYEDYSAEDWALRDVGPATIPTVLTLGANPDNYNLYLASVSIRYSFGRAKPAAAEDEAEAQ